ncbi:MAG: DNA translocase FtsK 4TM domain-containing protein [Candidatus Omnitrophota bacterium]
MREKRLNEIKGVLLIALGLMLLASLIRPERLDLSFYTSYPNNPPLNPLGIFGAYLGGILVLLIGRITSLVLPLLILFLGISMFRQKEHDLRLARVVGGLVFLISLSSLAGMVFIGNETSAFYLAGFLGFSLSRLVTTYLGRLGGYIVFTTLAVLSFVLVTDILLSMLISRALEKIKGFKKPVFRFKRSARSAGVKSIIMENSGPRRESLVSEPKIITREPRVAAGAIPKPKIQIKLKENKEPLQPKIKPSEVKVGDYHLPSLELLDSPPPLEARQIKEDLQASARILEETLEDFGISAKVTDIERGPVITRYELEPAPGVKLNRIVALGDDIALAMKAQSVRIVAPIPGKGRVGVEVPNTQSSFVYLKEVLSSAEFQDSKSRLALALGKDISGHPVVTDLSDMPHLLIAGTTGSGKTVCVNSLILSMLLKNTPQELKFLMVDPKMVELMPFNGLPHLLCPVITDAKKAAVALTWALGEMEERYRLFSKVSARNIDSYNQKQERIPYIVIIIDELADLMMVSRDQIENAITRLAQLSRAVGIHLVLATQRPSVDVVTGVIKANFPARISFKVASKVDSRTVLDMNGADKLLGKGDMLFLRPGESKLVRAQGCLVTDKEIERLGDFIKSQAEPIYDEEILQGQEKAELHSGVYEKDELYEDAVRIIMESNQASVSILQRRLRLGYTRAARIIDTMEQEGMIGPFEGSKPRKILVDRENWLEDKVIPQEEES